MKINSIAEIKQSSESKTTEFGITVILRNLNIKLTRNGKKFIIIEIGDRSGSIIFNCFDSDYYFNQFLSLKIGSIVTIEGQANHHQNHLNLRVSSIDIPSKNEIERGSLVNYLTESLLKNVDLLWNECILIIEGLNHFELKSTIKKTIEEVGDAFLTNPAAISMHHAYRHGLLDHTVSMAKAANALLPLYPEVNFNLAITGVILHDIGKGVEYRSGYHTKKTSIGILQGHVILGYRIVRKSAIQSNLPIRLINELEHIILSHQGEIGWGAAVTASTPEAVFVSMVDNLDAKMNMVRCAVKYNKNPDKFSNYILGLKAPVITSYFSRK